MLGFVVFDLVNRESKWLSQSFQCHNKFNQLKGLALGAEAKLNAN